jgi:sortase (surface protein transpeptidase)
MEELDTAGTPPAVVTRVSIRTATWRLAAVVLLVGAVYCMVQWSDRSSPAQPDAADPASSSTPTQQSQTPSTEPARRPKPASAAPAKLARPVAIDIPAIGVQSVLAPLGLNADGTVEVPADPAEAGWYKLGTRPGALGSAVILGHVDSTEGPAVFYLLSTLSQGDAVDVRLADGTLAQFRVSSVRTYANEQFPAAQVYAAKGARVLNLVTCGGSYDAARGGYQANVVVNARWVRTRQG